MSGRTVLRLRTSSGRLKSRGTNQPRPTPASSQPRPACMTELRNWQRMEMRSQSRSWRPSMGAAKGSTPHNAGKGKGWTDPRGYRVQSKTVNGKRQQVREHRAIMEDCIGRKLEPWEIVHHKDGNPLNNALDNLEVMDFASHTSEH